MKSVAKPLIIVLSIIAALVLGYWWGSTQPATREAQSTGAPDSPQLKSSQPPETAKLEGKTGKILYYRNPMGQPDTSPVPKKDPMGMDYLPVYEGESSSQTPVVTISAEKIQKLGVRTEAVAPRQLTRTVRAVATVQADERRLYTVTPKFEGWIQKLYVNTTGQAVKKGEPLMEVYSPELNTAQHEYLIAKRGLQSVEDASPEVRTGMQQLAESALQRLRNWDISEIDLQRLRQEGEIKHYVTLRSTVSGVVIEKSAVQGKRFMPGDALYQIADLSSVWMLADVFEQDLNILRPGQTATIRIDTYPGKIFNGKVTFVYPTVVPETRTAKVRIELSNAQGLLKPAMYGRVEFAASHSKTKVLAVPDSAVLDTGTRRLVLVTLGEGRFEPRTVKLGMHADGYAEVLEGLAAGEAVVVSANFLIDAESNLKAALGGFSHHGPASTPNQAPVEPGEPVKAGVSLAAPAPASHHGSGRIEAVDWAQATVTIAHDPIASLGWPAMTMEFHARDPALLRLLKPGQKVEFQIAEEPAGEYAIVRVQPVQPPATSHAASPAHDQRGQ